MAGMFITITPIASYKKTNNVFIVRKSPRRCETTLPEAGKEQIARYIYQKERPCSESIGRNWRKDQGYSKNERGFFVRLLVHTISSSLLHTDTGLS